LVSGAEAGAFALAGQAACLGCRSYISVHTWACVNFFCRLILLRSNISVSQLLGWLMLALARVKVLPLEELFSK